MLVEFFFLLKKGGLPVSITEFLALLEALKQQVARADIEEFYFLSRACLIKDERHYDRYDQIFAAHFNGAEANFAGLAGSIPLE